MERITRFRAALLLTLFLIIVGFFAVKLYSLQIVEAEDNINSNYFIIQTTVKAARGDILDRNGNALVSNRASYNLVFVPYVINNAKGTSNYLLQLYQLCEQLDVEYIDHFPITKERPFEYTLDDYSSTWQGYFQKFLANKEIDSDISAPLLMERLRTRYKIPEEWSDTEARAVIGIYYELALRSIANLSNYIFIEDVDDKSLAAILELNTPGLRVEASTVREYATEYAAHILGHTGAMSPKQWEYYKTIDGYNMDAVVGQSGLELAFEEQLHGIDGLREDVFDKEGNLISTRWITEPKAGNNVETSIDLNLQRIAEEQLAQTIEQLRAQEEEDADGKDAEGGAVVAMDPNTGEILACASYPTYNLATFNQDYDTLKEDPYKPMINRALQGLYPPGSTYKMCMVISGIDHGYINATYEIEDKGVYTKYDGQNGPKCLAWSTNRTTHQMVNSMKALQKSCNYYFYVLGDMMNIDDIDETAKGFGLGESTGVELYEETGYRANEETKAKLYKGENAQWYAGDQILAAIGQSDNRFTPLQLCVYVSTLAKRGTRYEATFLQRVVSSDYRTLVEDNAPTIASTMTISDEAYTAVLEGMKLVARSGTAAGTFSSYPVDIAAKTGTAETGKHGASDNGSFVCFAPASEPQIAIAVYGEQAGHGSAMATVAKSMLDYYLNIGESSDVNSYENAVS